MIIHQLTDGGMFAHDSIGQRWRGYSAWLSRNNDTLFGRQGCTMHYKMKVSYIPEGDRIVINDTIVLQHLSVSIR